MLSPAKDFSLTPHGRTWQSVVGEEQFQEASKAAMLAYADDISRDNPAEAGLRLQGAYAFLRKLFELGRTPTQQPPPRDTLNLTR